MLLNKVSKGADLEFYWDEKHLVHVFYKEYEIQRFRVEDEAEFRKLVEEYVFHD